MVYLYHQDNAWSSVSFLVSFWFWFSDGVFSLCLTCTPSAFLNPGWNRQSAYWFLTGIICFSLIWPPINHAIRRQSSCEGFLYYLFLRSWSTALFFLCETRRDSCWDRTGPELGRRMFRCVTGCVCSQRTLYRFCSVWISYRQFYNITAQATSHAFNLFDSLTPFDCLFFNWFTLLQMIILSARYTLLFRIDLPLRST